MEMWALFRSPDHGGSELVYSEYDEIVLYAIRAYLSALEHGSRPDLRRCVWCRIPIGNCWQGGGGKRCCPDCSHPSDSGSDSA